MIALGTRDSQTLDPIGGASLGIRDAIEFGANFGLNEGERLRLAK